MHNHSILMQGFNALKLAHFIDSAFYNALNVAYLGFQTLINKCYDDEYPRSSENKFVLSAQSNSNKIRIQTPTVGFLNNDVIVPKNLDA